MTGGVKAEQRLKSQCKASIGSQGRVDQNIRRLHGKPLNQY